MGSWTELVAGLYRLDLLWRQSSVGRSRSANRPRGCTATCCEAWAVPGPSQRGRRGSQQVGRRDAEGGAQVSAGWLFSSAPALLTRELSARVNTRRDVRGVSTERQSQGGAGAPPAMPGRGVQGATSPGAGRPPPGNPEPSLRTGGAGGGAVAGRVPPRGWGRAGPAGRGRAMQMSPTGGQLPALRARLRASRPASGLETGAAKEQTAAVQGAPSAA